MISTGFQFMEPIMRKEMYLAKMCNESDKAMPQPITRLEHYMHNVANGINLLTKEQCDMTTWKVTNQSVWSVSHESDYENLFTLAAKGGVFENIGVPISVVAGQTYTVSLDYDIFNNTSSLGSNTTGFCVSTAFGNYYIMNPNNISTYTISDTKKSGKAIIEFVAPEDNLYIVINLATYRNGATLEGKIRHIKLERGNVENPVWTPPLETLSTPIIREEFYWAYLLGKVKEVPTPITRVEMYLYAICGNNIKLPEPITREEIYLNKINELRKNKETDA